MNKNLARVGKNVLETNSGREKAGMELFKVGGFGLALWVLAGFIPFVTLPMIFGMLVLLGFVL